MINKFEIKQQIKDNIRLRKRGGGLDKLDFLLPVGFSNDSFELGEDIVLKNSWKKKILNYLLYIILITGIVSWAIVEMDADDRRIWLLVVLFIIITIPYFTKFLESKVILKITDKGLFIGYEIFCKWSDVGYLHFKTKYGPEGEFDGTYLIITLKNNTEEEVLISDLSWSKDKLGMILYQSMRKYAKS